MNAMDYPYHLTKDLSPLTLELKLGIKQVPLGIKVKLIFCSRSKGLPQISLFFHLGEDSSLTTSKFQTAKASKAIVLAQYVGV